MIDSVLGAAAVSTRMQEGLSAISGAPVKQA